MTWNRARRCFCSAGPPQADDAETLRKSAERGVRVVMTIAGGADTRPDALSKSWGLPLATDQRNRHSHELYFPEARDWTVIDRAGPKILAVEKPFGKGAIAIWSESDDFSNESTAAGDRFDTITKALGANRRIVFDERHFGIAETGSVMALARRFRLTGMALGLGLCAVLLLWRNAFGFPPPVLPSTQDRLRRPDFPCRIDYAAAAQHSAPRTRHSLLGRMAGGESPAGENAQSAACRGNRSPIRQQAAAGVARRTIRSAVERRALNLDQFQAAMEQVTAEVRKVIIGQEDAVRYSLVVILCNQHALIEGVPGLAKTLLARTLAAVMGSEFKRIQFTPDLMPADITGNNVFNLQRNEFSLVKGPLFTTFLLADEINRAPAKTQSALLEAMQERTVTIDRESHRLSPTSRSSPRRTRLNPKAPTRCPRRRKTASC